MESALYGIYALVFVSEISLVRFLIHKQLVRKYRTSTLSMKYSLCNIRSEFSIKICARALVKIDHVIFIYVTTPHSESAVLAITHENRVQ